MSSATKKIFFIGVGNMGGAILCALTEGGYPANSIFFFEPNAEQADKIAERSKAKKMTFFYEGFSEADVVFLCVKPQIFSKIFTLLATELKKNGKEPVIVSIIAGVTVSTLQAAFPENKKIVRAMPNIAVVAKKGTVAIATEGVEEDVLQTVEFLFSQCANTFRVFENQMDAITGLSGSGPAFVFQFVEALIMGGVKMGLQRDVAMKFVLSMIQGSIEMLTEFQINPNELIANICSPAGTTIAGIQELENRAFRGTVMAAVEAAAKRSAELGNG